MQTANLQPFASIYFGAYHDDGRIIDDACPQCHWDPWATPAGRAAKAQDPNDDPDIYDHLNSSMGPAWSLGMMWMPGVERGIGAYFQIYHCQQCGIVYACHVN